MVTEVNTLLQKLVGKS